MLLKDKKILLGICGGIAAYKIPMLVRLLIKEGAQVKVIMTPSAAQFVTPHTLSVLSKNAVFVDFFDATGQWNNHVHLAEWADVLLIAPLTANTLAKMATGQCDNLLTATYLSAWKKTTVAPAMDRDMYLHPGVQSNLRLIATYGTTIIPPETGELASGLTGEGRMVEPETVFAHLKSQLGQSGTLAGKTALVNAGPTHEAIDPVRFIGNHSSGKMGIEIARELAARGARVKLVLGPAQSPNSLANVELIHVTSSDQMYNAMLEAYPAADIVVCAAAVADYKPARVSTEKIKKDAAETVIELVKTKDILAELGKQKTKQYLVGFALETSDLETYARKKLVSKNLDMVVANSAVEPGSGFGTDTNKITILDKHNKITKFELKPKREVACDIVNYICSHMV